MAKIIFRDSRKRPVSISVPDEINDYLAKKPNRSDFVVNLIRKAMEEEGQEAGKPVEWEVEEQIELSHDEKIMYSYMGRHAFEYGCQTYGNNYLLYNYPLDTTLLRIHLGDVMDKLRESDKALSETICRIREDEDALNELQRKFSLYWRQIKEKDIPEELKKEAAPGITFIDLMSKLGSPIDKTLSIHDVASKLGISYMKVYNSIRPVLEKYGYHFIEKGD
jgi:predicted DNA-binding protein YlxM (UPF0122 family)